jgi:hypothetical protein
MDHRVKPGDDDLFICGRLALLPLQLQSGGILQ